MDIKEKKWTENLSFLSNYYVSEFCNVRKIKEMDRKVDHFFCQSFSSESDRIRMKRKMG